MIDLYLCTGITQYSLEFGRDRYHKTDTRQNMYALLSKLYQGKYM